MAEFKLITKIYGLENEISPSPLFDIIIRWQKDLIILSNLNSVSINETLDGLLSKHNVRFEVSESCHQFQIKGFGGETVYSNAYPDLKTCQESYKEFIKVVKKLRDKYDE